MDRPKLRARETKSGLDSNLLQVDRFEEDLNISRVRLQSKPRTAGRPPITKADESAEEKRIEPEEAVAALKELAAQLRRRSGSGT